MYKSSLNSTSFFDKLACNYPELIQKSLLNSVMVGTGYQTIVLALFDALTFKFKSAEQTLTGTKTLFEMGTLSQEVLDRVQAEYDSELANLPEIRQIKVKFNSLRVYVTGEDPYVTGIIQMTEQMARHTCFTCGKQKVFDGLKFDECKHLGTQYEI